MLSSYLQFSLTQAYCFSRWHELSDRHHASLKHSFDGLKAKAKQVPIFTKVLTDKHAILICIKDNNLTLFYYLKDKNQQH